MKYKSALVTQGSGSVGGMTASRNKGGNYMRSRAVPTNPNTMRQAAVREAIGMLANMWATLSQAARDSWKAYADNVPVINALGDTIKITALNQFIRSNSPRMQAGLPVLSPAPIIFNIGETLMVTDITVQVGGVTPTIEINWAAADLTADDTVLVYLSKPLSPTINYFRGPYRFVAGYPGNGGNASILPAEYPFPYAVGQKVIARLTISRVDGRLSAPAQVDTLAVIGT